MINHPRMATAIRGYKTRRIMKKEYIKPEMVVEEMLLEGILAMSLPEGDKDQELDAPGRQDRRGRWGNLWDKN